MPHPADYFAQQGLKLTGGGEWKNAICPFHDDTKPSLRVRLDTGGFRGNELLADIQHVFENKRVDKISTVDLIAALCADEEAAWATYSWGKPITPRQVARQLAGYGIASKTIRLGAYETPKGFELSQFSDAFVRYLSTPLNLPQHPPQTLEANKHAALAVADYPQQKTIRNNFATPEAPPLLGCGGVSDKTPILGGAETSHSNTSHLRI